jgi:hypothetical protein
VLFWHRSSPQELVPIEDAAVTLEDPPSTVTDMREVVLDPAGRLMRFRSVPPQVDEDIGDVPPPWGALFDAAGLAISGFVDATPQWTPPDFADARVAWSGSHPVLTDVTLRVEAASYRGRPVFFEVVGPWTEPERMEAGRDSSLDRALIALILGIFGVLMVAAAVLARRHLRSDRADRRGASRITAYISTAGLLAWLLRASHTASMEGEVALFYRAASDLTLLAVIFWTVYVALEPYLRRLWPDALLGWSRLLAGHVRDPRVGREVLAGLACGVAAALVAVAKATLIPALGLPAPYPQYGFAEMMFGDPTSGLWGALLESVAAIGGALFAVFGIVILRLVLRSRWLATGVTACALAMSAAYDLSPVLPSLVFPLATGALRAARRLQRIDGHELPHGRTNCVAPCSHDASRSHAGHVPPAITSTSSATT